MSKVYKKITFAHDYDRSFEEFKEDFADNHVFLSIPRDKVDEEYVKAYAIATGNKSQVKDGQFQLPAKESKKTDTNEVK